MPKDDLLSAADAAAALWPCRDAHDMLELCHPFRPATRFRWDMPLSESNGTHWVLETDERWLPFRFIRGNSVGPGKRPVLLLLHGMGLHIASFSAIGRWLLATHDVLLVDWNSFCVPPEMDGQSVAGSSLRELMHAAMCVPNALGIGRFACGGSSLGGGLSLMAALDYPQQITELLLFNPAFYPQKLPSFYRLLRVPLLGEFIMTIMPPEKLICGVTSIGYSNPALVNPALMKAYQANMKTRSNRLKLMDVVRQLPTREAEVQGYMTRAGQLHQPVLVMWGLLDPLLRADSPQKLRQDLPNVRVVEYADLSHLPHEEAPERLGPLASEFLRSCQQRLV
ncbi:MAG: alpha/beta hydrolase [Phycisphaerales bacterium]|nr:alpha/beta hydrolase [Phycisphaerales bacterium]